MLEPTGSIMELPMLGRIPQEMILRRGKGKVLKKNKLKKIDLITKYTWRKMKKQDPKVDDS